MAALPQRVSGSTDEALAERVARGEDDAFEELYRRYARPLASYGARLLGDRTAGEDVAQSALLNAYQAIRRGHGPVRVRAWLYGIAQNTSYDMMRRRRDVVTADVESICDHAAPDTSDRAALLAAVRELPARQRDVYLLRELKGQPISEIASRLDLEVEQVEQALFAARNRLAEHLVFGGRLTCSDAQRLHGGPLGSIERRALKSHVRKCQSCRAAGLGRGPAFGFAGLLDGLRQLLQPLAGGGVLPAVAGKGGAVVIAAVAGGSVFGVHAAIHSAFGSRSSSASPAAVVGPAPPTAGSALALAAVVQPFAPRFLRQGTPEAAPSAAPAADAVGPGAPPPARGPAAAVPPDTGGTTTDSTTTTAAAQDQAGRVSADATSTDPTPADTTSTDTPPADTTPAATTPADTTPTDTTPTDTPPADAPPADQPPADTLPADPLPPDTTAAPTP